VRREPREKADEAGKGLYDVFARLFDKAARTED
jgi:hypothetical protein